MEKAQEEHGYNGWTNYETWAVSLWLDNEQPSYHYWREQADRHRKEGADSPRVQDGTWNADEAARFNLADQLKQEVMEASPLTETSLYTDLLGAALSEVDWLEIVDHWLAE